MMVRKVKPLHQELLELDKLYEQAQLDLLGAKTREKE